MKNATHFVYLLSCFLLQSAHLMADSTDHVSASTYPFIENKGQIVDQNGSVRTDVHYLYQQDGFKIILRATGFSYEFTRSIPLPDKNSESGLQQYTTDEEDLLIPDQQLICSRIDVELVNCNNEVELSGEMISPFYTNFFNAETGSAGITGVRNYQEVVYKNIYDGINLVFKMSKGKNGDLHPKYEFVVTPSGNMKDILLAYNGQQRQLTDAAGNLLLNTESGFVQELQPIILFADGSLSHHGQFELKGNQVSFKNVRHAKDQTFIIDPVILWGTYYGGLEKDLTDEIAVDQFKNTYITGRTNSYSMIATAGAHQTVWQGGSDVPLIKFNESGNLVWATYYGGHANDVAFAIALDHSNNIFVGGRTVSYEGIHTPGALDSTFSGGYFDVLLAKFDPAGVLKWGTYMGNDLKDEVQNLWCNKEGDVYVSGYSESLEGIATPGSFKSVGDTAGEVFLVKFNNTGQQLWGTYFGDNGRDRGHGVCTDDFGFIYQTGTLDSKLNIATPGAYQTEIGGLLDLFLAKWTPDGQLVWCTYYGGEGDDRGRDVRCDGFGNVYFVGQTESEIQISSPGAYKTTLEYDPYNNRDALVAKFTPDGKRVWCTYFGGNFIDMPRSLRVSRLGAPVVIGGYTKSMDDFITPDAYQKKIGGKTDAFIAKFNWNGSQLMYSTYYGGKKSEAIGEGGWYGSCLDLDADGNIYLSSGTASSDSIATPGAYKTTIAAPDQYDFFLAKFADPCSDPFEPNDSASVVPELPFNADTSIFMLKAQIQKNDDKDYFVFRSKPGQHHLIMDLTTLPIDCDIFVYDSSLLLLDKSQNAGLADESVIIESTYVGKYYILVKNPSGNTYDVANCYTLKVTGDSSPATVSGQLTELLAEVTLYPNPVTDAATLMITSKKKGNCSIEIVDLTGKSLISFKASVNGGENNIALPAAQLVVGNYLVKVMVNGMQYILKLNVQR